MDLPCDAADFSGRSEFSKFVEFSAASAAAPTAIHSIKTAMQCGQHRYKSGLALAHICVRSFHAELNFAGSNGSAYSDPKDFMPTLNMYRNCRQIG